MRREEKKRDQEGIERGIMSCHGEERKER